MFRKLLLGLTAITLVLSFESLAGDDQPDYEEIGILLNVERLGNFNINAIYSYDNESLYLPVIDFFQIMQIKMDISPNYDTIQGFYIKEDRPYMIDYPSGIIRVDDKVFQLDEADMIHTEKGLFLHTALFGKAFGLYCDFNFRNLSVKVETDMDVPAIRDIRKEKLRRRKARLTEEIESDTTLGRRYHAFRGGMADWAFNFYKSQGKRANTRFSLGLGSELLWGEANAFLNHSTRYGFQFRRQSFRWRWVNNNLDLIKQVQSGKINTPSISDIYAPLWGITATNAPTTYRRSFGEYTISDYTEPEWMVELYVNNVLVDYTQADASGFYSFDVPLVYGTSNVELRFYGPHGEERVEQKFINIPYNFLPPGEIEYTFSGGRLLDEAQSLFSRAEMNIGVNKFVTFGGGMEYLSSIPTKKKIPFLSTSANLFRNLLIKGEYARNVKTSALLNYRTPFNLRFKLNYINYVEGQKAIRTNAREERAAQLTMPLRFNDFRLYTRLLYRQNVYARHIYNRGQMMLSGGIGSFDVNVSASANWTEAFTPNVVGNLALRYRLRNGIRLSARSRTDMVTREIVSYETGLNWRISNKGYLSFSYKQYPRARNRTFNLTFRYDLSFAQTNLSIRSDREDIYTSQGIRGSLAFGSGKGYVYANNRSAVKKGGLTLVPFLDINHSGHRDDNEPLVSSLDVKIAGGNTISEPKDSLIRIMGLEPYTSYQLTLDENSLKNIAWRLPNETMEVHVDPNQFKKIRIPVQVMGEVSGMVYRSYEDGLRGYNRINVEIYRQGGELVSTTTSGFDGYFSYLGLPPGEYYARVDTQQLEKLGLTSEPEKIDFTIDASEFGDIEDGLEFVLEPKTTETNP